MRRNAITSTYKKIKNNIKKRIDIKRKTNYGKCRQGNIRQNGH